MRWFYVFVFYGVDVNAEAVVLGGYFDLSCLEVFDGVVCSVVAKLEFIGFSAECEGEYLVSEAYTEDGDF